MISDFANFIAGQWKVISQAFPAFVTATIFLGVLVWLFARNHFSGQIDSLRERITLRDDQLEMMEKKLGADSPSDALLKLGSLTARIEALSIGKWDPLTETQIRDLRVRLSPLGKKEITVELTDDARALGYSIDKILDELGWSIKGIRVIGGGSGIKVGPESDDATAVAQALRAVGFEVEFDSGMSGRPLALYLGSKPFYE